MNGEQQAVYQASENFFRSIISSSFGLQVLDNLVNAIIRTLKAELEKFKDNKHILNLMMAYTPELAISPIYKKTKHIDNQILIGNKGYFLKELASFNFPYPSRLHPHHGGLQELRCSGGLQVHIQGHGPSHQSEVLKLEKTLGKKYGDPENPLLLSVRSGATISLPGMMHSFLNVGINEKIAEGLSKKKGFEWAAWDSYRRFLQTWGMFQNLDRNFFDRIISDFKFKYNIDRKIQFNAEQMRQIALSYKRAMEERGIEVIDDPPSSSRRRSFRYSRPGTPNRRIYTGGQMHLSNEWGTAVIVQAMVFGNLNEDSGIGRDLYPEPEGLFVRRSPFMETSSSVFRATISYRASSRPTPSRKSRGSSRAGNPDISLRTRFPGDLQGAGAPFRGARLSETIQPPGDRVYLRDTHERRTPHPSDPRHGPDRDQEAQDLPGYPRSAEVIVGAGIGVSGGALSGRAVFSEEEIKQFRSDEPDTPLILIRPDTGLGGCGHNPAGRRNSYRKRGRDLPCGSHHTPTE